MKYRINKKRINWVMVAGILVLVWTAIALGSLLFWNFVFIPGIESIPHEDASAAPARASHGKLKVVNWYGMQETMDYKNLQGSINL